MPAPEDQLRALCQAEPTGGVLTVYARTDPRDPANISQVPAWLIAARNGLRELGASVERAAERTDRVLARDLAAEANRCLEAVDPTRRGRSMALFVTRDGCLRRLTLQLPVRDHHVVWDARPFISPLVEIVDRAQTTGVVLVDGERLRLLTWAQGRIEEPPRATWTFSVPRWRRYAGYAAANPARGQQTVTHQERYRSRLENRRDRFFAGAAHGAQARLAELGARRLVVVAEPSTASRLAAALSPAARERIVGALDANLAGLSPPEIATRVESLLEDHRRRETDALARQVLRDAAAGDRAVAGAEQTLAALAEHRVERLLVDAAGVDHRATLGAQARSVLRGGSPSLLAERAVEAAILAGAGVAMCDDQPGRLREHGGIAARLRW
jgi:protein required for attachment to host cells